MEPPGAAADAAMQAALEARAQLEAALRARFEALERKHEAKRARLAQLTEDAGDRPLPDLLAINAGGDESFRISRAAVTRRPSHLAEMFSGRWDHKLPKDAGGRFFLDVDRHQMRAIFDWLEEHEKFRFGDPFPPRPRERLPVQHRWGIDDLMQYFKFEEPAIPGPEPVPAPHDDEICRAANLCALRVRKAEQEVDAALAALEEEQAFMAQHCAALEGEGAIVLLTASGVPMATARATLLQEEGSVLATKFGPTWHLQDEELVDGRAVLDAHPDNLGQILQYLRFKRLGLPDLGLLSPYGAHSAQLPRLVDYYGLTGLKCGPPLSDSAILSADQQAQLVAWLQPDLYTRLLYRASRDGFGWQAFHARCDNRGATLVVALSAGGYRFGGFSDVPWTSATGFYASTEAFLFGLGGPASEPPIAKCPLLPGKGHMGIVCDGHHGPLFGGGRDLRFQVGDRSCQCHFDNFGHTYQAPPGVTFLAEAKAVTVTEYEVFRIA